MAGDWVKMRNNLWTDPKVVTLASRLRNARVTVIGALHGAWSLLDQHGVNGVLKNVTPEVLDAHVEVPGFTAAMAEVGWIVVRDSSLQFPGYEEHNGPTAKRRSQNAKRQSKHREASRSSNAAVTQASRTCVTREEKIREDKNISPKSPYGDSSHRSDEDERWRRFVALYPPNRDGRVPSQAEAEAYFRALPSFQQDEALVALNHYATTSAVADKCILSPVNFLRGNRWAEWLEPPKATATPDVSRNSVLPLEEFLALNNQRGAQ